jgi:hypothetical protein
MDDYERREHQTFSYLVCLDEALQGLSTRERLEVLLTDWLLHARQPRQEAQEAPAEGARQVGQLRDIAELIETDEPDRVMERLHLDGKLDAVLLCARGRPTWL